MLNSLKIRLKSLNIREIPKIVVITVKSINLSENKIDNPSKYEHLKYFLNTTGVINSPILKKKTVFKNCLNNTGLK